MSTINIGVIGTGRMGKNHCRIFSTMRGVTLAGIYDTNQAAGRKIAAEYLIPFYDSLEEMLSQLDAVSIATPTPSHFDLAMRCLDRGLHVFIEKPITETIEEAEILAARAENSSQVVQIGHIERFNPTYTELKYLLEEMTVLAVNFRRLSPNAGSNFDVNVVLDLMIHDLDLVLDLVPGPPIAMSASGLTASHGPIDHAVLNLEYQTGPLLVVTASRLTEQKVRTIEITALEGYVVANLLDKQILVHRSTRSEYLNNRNHGVKYRQESTIERIYVPQAEPLLLELQHFADCIQTGRTPAVTAANGLAALRLAHQTCEAIGTRLIDVECIRAQQPVAVSA